ncbi:MAG: hypothetical protein WC564_01450 [Patescibacteria group bacterium]
MEKINKLFKNIERIYRQKFPAYSWNEALLLTILGLSITLIYFLAIISALYDGWGLYIVENDAFGGLAFCGLIIFISGMIKVIKKIVFKL